MRKKEKITACKGCFFVLMILGLCWMMPSAAIAQAPDYSREEVLARARKVLDSEGIKISNESIDTRWRGDMLMTGSEALGRYRRENVRDNRGLQSAMLRYDQHREVKPPADPTIHVGPWYNDIVLGVSAGVQYIRMTGDGVGFITQNGRGRYLKDGFDMPVITTLGFDNHVLLTRHMDFAFNINVSYAYYPFNTQEDNWYVNMSDEGIYATFSTEIELARDMRLLLYDDILYRTDYIDTRGMEDIYGGEEYEHFENTVGADYDWKLTRFDNISLSASRRDVISMSDEFDDQEGAFYSELVSYQRQVSRFATVGLAGDFSQSLYKVDERPDINMFGFTAFGAAQLTRTFFGNAAIGYDYSSTSDDGYSTDSAGSLSGTIGLGQTLSDNSYHEVSYRRSQHEAFHGGVDVTDTLRYNLHWAGGRLPGNVYTEYIMFNPVGDMRGSYSDWRSRLELSHQLTRRLTLHFDTTYDVRMNDPLDSEDDPLRPEVTSDYQTWTIRLGTEFPVTKKTSLSVYGEHATRMSDNEDLEYSQDSIVALLNWRHKF